MLFKSLPLQQSIPFAYEHFHRYMTCAAKRGNGRAASLLACAVVILAALTCAKAVAQSPDISSLEAYVDAIKQPNVADQINSMERFLQVAGQSTLRLDALEILVMDYQKTNNSERAVARAHDLLNTDPANPLAIAVLNENGVPSNNRKGRNDDYNAARRGLTNVDLMHKPEGMGQAQFMQLQQKIRGMLAGAIGMGYLDQQDYEKAANYLQQAVAAEPQSARYNYGLAQAILSGSNGNNADAYWLLAKAVNLAKGTPNEQQIASDSLRKYRENGGSEAVWNQLLAAAAASNAQSNAAPTSTNAQPAQSQTAAPASNPGGGNSSTSTSTPSTETAKRTTQVTNAPATPSSSTASSSTASSTPPSSTPSASAPAANNSANTTTVVSPTTNAPATSSAGPGTAGNASAVTPANTAATTNTAPSPASPASAVNSGSNSSQATVADRGAAHPVPPAAQPSQTQAPATQAPVTQTPVNNNAPAATSPGQPQGSATPPAPQAKTNVPPSGNSGSVTWEYVTPGNSSNAAPSAAHSSAAASRSNNIGAPQNPAQQNTTTVATASPPAVRGNATNLPESDQPSLVVRPPATSSMPAGPTSAPLPDRKPAVSPPPVVTNPIITAPTGPVSLGILIQTELLSGNYREPIMESMREMARNLRPGDEAFIMAFSDQLDFEQDLTENDELLEEGLRNLQPKPGAALFEGMTFAVQHLKRIGKNGNRVLLIISDGRNVPSTNGQQHLDADVSRVRIDCIGLDVEQALDRQNLQKLAYWSGGMTSFVNDPEQIRTAASSIARTIVGEGFANR